jgi:site-specific recombinase XerD
MARFKARRQSEGAVPFEVIGDDGPVPVVHDFLAHLVTCGRASYTVRSYAQGLADFFAWFDTHDVALDDAGRQTVVAYLGDFRAGAKAGAASVRREQAGRVHPVTRKVAPAVQRQPRTINHRLSVLSSFFDFLIRRDRDADGQWANRTSPVPAAGGDGAGSHGSPGRDAPRRGRRGELRQRPPRRLPRAVEPALAQQLVAEARSWRDKALLTLLWRSGQRIGDWHEVHGCHGLLGLRLADVDETSSSVLVRLKGARDEHRVPVTEDFWPLWRRYLVEERCFAETPAAWVAFRRGAGRPLTYAAFESSLRYVGAKLDVNVNAHMFRHALAQAVVATSGVKVAQEILGHRHIATTADTYAHVDPAAMVEAVTRAKAWCDLDGVSPSGVGFVFAYDADTIAELDSLGGWDDERESEAGLQ